jgi:hypothetical protein
MDVKEKLLGTKQEKDSFRSFCKFLSLLGFISITLVKSLQQEIRMDHYVCGALMLMPILTSRIM